MKVKVYLNYQSFKPIISGVSKHAFCWQIFHNFTILPVASIYIHQIVCCIRKHKEIVVQNVQILK